MTPRNPQDITATRPFGRYRPSLGALFGTALVAALSAASPSIADTGSSTLLSYSPTEIAKIGVNSDGTAYQATSLINLSAQVQVVVDAEISGKVKSWKTWLRVQWENGPWVHFSNDAGFVKLTDIRLISEFLHKVKSLKLHEAAISELPRFVVNPVNLTMPLTAPDQPVRAQLI